MTPDKGVFKRKGSAVWQHRVVVPKDVRSFYGDKTELPARSLGTRDLAEANTLARKRLAQYEAEFAAHRRHRPPPISGRPGKAPLAAKQIEILAERHRTSVVDIDFAESAQTYAKAKADPFGLWRGSLIPLPESYQTRHQGWSAWDMLCEDENASLETGVAFLLNARRKVRLQALRQALRIGNVDVVASIADNMLSSYEHDAGQRLILIKRLIEVEIGALAQILDKEAAHFPGVFDDGMSALGSDAENPLLSVATKAWIAEKSSLDLTPRRIEDCQAAVSLFTEVVGDRPIGNYSKGDVRQFKDVLRKLPSNRNKRRETRGLSVQAAIKKAEKLGLDTMATKTANNKYLGALFNLFEYAIGNYDKVDRNPFQNATLPTTSTPREEWDPFSLEALRTFFNAPLYRGCRSAKYWLEPGHNLPRDSVRFWLPLVLMYTGARVNEACKLRPADIGEEGGIRYFDIVWEDDDEATGIAGRVKNASSKRRVPLHADLVSFGFLEFVDRARSRGQERLFSELKANRYGKLYGTISQRFSDTYLPKLGIKTDKTSLKSFRHNFVDAAKNSRMPDDIIQALRGDTRRGMLGRYGHGKTDLEVLADEMVKLRFKGMDLSHLIVVGAT